MYRVEKPPAKVLISDSDSGEASEPRGDDESDFSSSSESQQSPSSDSSAEDSADDSPPPAKRGKKVLYSFALIE